MDRLQPVPRIGQRAADDHAHRVIEIGTAHLVFDGDRGDIALRRRTARGAAGRRPRTAAVQTVIHIGIAARARLVTRNVAVLGIGQVFF